MQWIIDTMAWLPAIVVAITFHEYAHGRVADMLGDSTPYDQGRLTLNPLAHVDWIGFLMLVIFKFGWAKPVLVNPDNFKNVGVKRGMFMVALAGPAMNVLLAFLGMVAIKYIAPVAAAEWAKVTILLLQPLVRINLILAAFNLIPVPPLDGAKVLAGLLPDEGAAFIYSLEQYGMFILLLLIVTGAASMIFWPIAQFLYGLLTFIIF